MAGTENASHAFLRRVLAAGKAQRVSVETLASSVFATTVCTAALYSKAIAHIVDFYLDPPQSSELEEIVGIARGVRGPQGDSLLLRFAKEAMRECAGFFDFELC